MTESLHIVCPHCHTTNRVRQADLAQAPDCGSCHQPLFVAHSLALGASQFDRHISRSHLPCWSIFGRPGAARAARWRLLLSKRRHNWSRISGWSRSTPKPSKVWAHGSIFAAFPRWRCFTKARKWHARPAPWGRPTSCVGPAGRVSRPGVSCQRVTAGDGL